MIQVDDMKTPITHACGDNQMGNFNKILEVPSLMDNWGLRMKKP